MIEKLRGLSENKKRVTLWGFVIVLGVLLLSWWGKNLVAQLKNISSPQIPQELQEQFQETQDTLQFPSLDLQGEIPLETLELLNKELEDGNE